VKKNEAIHRLPPPQFHLDATRSGTGAEIPASRNAIANAEVGAAAKQKDMPRAIWIRFVRNENQPRPDRTAKKICAIFALRSEFVSLIKSIRPRTPVLGKLRQF